MLNQLRSQTIIVGVLVRERMNYWILNLYLINLDEETEVVLDTILMPIFHLQLEMFCCDPSLNHFEFRQNFHFWGSIHFSAKRLCWDRAEA